MPKRIRELSSANYLILYENSLQLKTGFHRLSDVLI